MALAKTQRNTRERILDVALDVFAEKSFSGTTVTAIERQVGLIPGNGSFYRYFRSKEDLLRTAVEREIAVCMEARNEERAKLPQSGDPEKQRVDLLRQILRDMRRFDRLIRLMMTETGQDTTVSEAIMAALPWSAEQLATRRDEPRSLVALAALSGYHYYELLRGGPLFDVQEDDFVETVAAVTQPPPW